MLQANFDESVHKGQISVCGFVAPEHQWKKVNSLCGRFFEEIGLPYLHMTDFMSSEASAYKSIPYAERSDVLSVIAEIIKSHVPMAIMISLDRASFESAASQRFKSQIGTAYTICATTAVILVGKLLRDSDIEWNVEWTFEHGHPGMEQLASRLTVLHEAAAQEFRIRSFGFSPSAPGIVPVLPLQLADALAFSALQPEGSFGFLDKLSTLKSRDILCSYRLEMNPYLIQKAYWPLAEIEAKARKMKKLRSEGLSIASSVSSYAQNVPEEKLVEVQRKIGKLNKIANLLGIDSRVNLVRISPPDHDVDDNGKA